MSENWEFVIAAFTVTWGALLGYFVHLRRARQRAQSLVDSVSATGGR